MGFSVKVSQIAAAATERDIYDFFSFSGDIQSIQISRDGDKQVAFVTFQEERSVDTALLLTGAVIQDHPIVVAAAEGYTPPKPSDAALSTSSAAAEHPGTHAQGIRKAEDVVASLLAAGYILGRDAADKAAEFDKEHSLSTQAAAQVSALQQRTAEEWKQLDSKYAISQRLQASASSVTETFKQVDSQYHLSNTAKEAAVAAGATLSTAAEKVLQNEYVQSSKSWLWGAMGKAMDVLSDVRQQAQEKVLQADAARGLVGGHPQVGGEDLHQLSAALEADATATTSVTAVQGKGSALP